MLLELFYFISFRDINELITILLKEALGLQLSNIVISLYNYMIKIVLFSNYSIIHVLFFFIIYYIQMYLS